MSRLEKPKGGPSVKDILSNGRVTVVDADDLASGKTLNAESSTKELTACRARVLKKAGARLVPGVQP